jgi:hypothetical protein
MFTSAEEMRNSIQLHNDDRNFNLMTGFIRDFVNESRGLFFSAARELVSSATNSVYDAVARLTDHAMTNTAQQQVIEFTNSLIAFRQHLLEEQQFASMLSSSFVVLRDTTLQLHDTTVQLRDNIRDSIMVRFDEHRLALLDASTSALRQSTDGLSGLFSSIGPVLRTIAEHPPVPVVDSTALLAMTHAHHTFTQHLLSMVGERQGETLRMALASFVEAASHNRGVLVRVPPVPVRISLPRELSSSRVEVLPSESPQRQHDTDDTHHDAETVGANLNDAVLGGTRPSPRRRRSRGESVQDQDTRDRSPDPTNPA